ncbi:GNAT family N-acetyltransferase [Amycolatopsis suaedae]|uniref:GNAT family N-acetyltransferase n=1 Tax=Amycolatopsis suaedae TaxID=2510978 RepID=UPI001F0D30F5|nr:GNAT family N-acetyltransferase [Amycolatopsis suaedae]
MTESADEVQVADNPARSCFEVHAGGELAGRADYRLLPGRMVLTHTEVGERFAGRGLAGRLARVALDSARDRGLAVTPECEYMAGWIRKHPEYLPLVDGA